MTIYSTDFSEYATGSPPSDWTDRWVTTNWTQDIATEASYGGKKLVTSTSTADARHLFTWDDVDADANRDDAEVLVRFKTSGGTYNFPLGVSVRAAGSSGLETGYALFAHRDYFYFQAYQDGTVIESVSLASVPFPNTTVDDEWHWIRFRANGSSFSFKIWKSIDDEPATWDHERTSTAITAAGAVGVIMFESTAPDTYWDYFAVGTNGDSPPLPVDATAPIRADQQFLQVAEEVTSPPIRADQQFLQVAEETGLFPIRADQQYLQVAYENVTNLETDFSEYATGSPPTGWTERWNTENVTWDIAEDATYDGGKYLTQSAHAADERILLSWDALDGATDVELLLRLKTSSGFNFTSDYFTYLHARASGAAGSETSYSANLLYQDFNMELQVRKFVAGTAGILSTYEIHSQEFWDFKLSTVYLLRFSVVGTSLKAKVWPDGTPEPGWHIEVTDTDISAGGWAGIGEYNNNKEIYYDYLSVGLDGTPAALSPNVETSSRLSQALAEVAITGTAPEARVTQALAEVAVVKPYPTPPAGSSSFVVVSINT